jgi:hypothetical protein
VSACCLARCRRACRPAGPACQAKGPGLPRAGVASAAPAAARCGCLRRSSTPSQPTWPCPSNASNRPCARQVELLPRALTLTPQIAGRALLMRFQCCPLSRVATVGHASITPAGRTASHATPATPPALRSTVSIETECQHHMRCGRLPAAGRIDPARRSARASHFSAQRSGLRVVPAMTKCLPLNACCLRLSPS